MKSPREELFQLLTIQFEQGLSSAQRAQLSSLLRSDESLVDDYVEYMSVQALLFWDAGAACSLSATVNLHSEEARQRVETQRKASRNASGWYAVLAAGMAIMAGWMFVSGQGPWGTPVVEQPINVPPQPATEVASTDPTSGLVSDNGDPAKSEIRPLILSHGAEIAANTTAQLADSTTNESKPLEALADNFADSEVSDRIDALIDQSLQDNEVAASPEASDSEWVRRVYLTLAGRIPTLTETQQFLTKDPQRKHADLLARVIDSSESSANFAGVWTNLLVGRTPRSHVNRDKLFEFLETSFASNTPWIDTVGELITARGRNDRNGATNFLLAHLNNEATPATAVTAKLFLGEQISCVQCHDHPFAKGVTQQDYWALNAFFKDTDRVSVAVAAGNSRGMQDIPWQLVDKVREERMTHFETRSGSLVGVLPTYDGKTLPADSDENRRESLARLLATDSNAKVARALVNRMWAHFFGYGFTAQIDDMGPHAAVSHPDLMNLLTEAFVKSDYDVRRLMKWIGGTAAWRRSSEMVATNANDRPDHGSVPLFSRVYVRRMTPEQVYESVRVAIRSSAGLRMEDQKNSSPNHQRDWVQQFAYSYNTDENDESLGFDGSIAQAMVMMNDTEVTQAIRQATAVMCSASPRPVAPISETIDQIALSIVNRQPTAEEAKLFRSHYRRLAQQTSPAQAMPVAVEDMMWAYLNSSEFMLVH